jgi:hypothetical protein
MAQKGTVEMFQVHKANVVQRVVAGPSLCRDDSGGRVGIDRTDEEERRAREIGGRSGISV